MRKYKGAFNHPFACMMSMTLFCYMAFPALAQEDRSDGIKEKKIMTLAPGEVINKDYFAYGEIVEISGTVNGDVYAAGGEVIVDGNINGDLIAAGGTIHLSGKISQNARVAGGNILISGEIGRNVTVGAGKLTVTEPSRIRGGIVAAGGSLMLSGSIGGDAVLAGGNLLLSNAIAGNVKAAAGRLRVGSKAVVSGNMTYWSNQIALIDEGAKIGGKIIARKIPEFPRPPTREFAVFLIFLALLAKIVSFISTLLVGWLLIYMFPKYHQDAVTTLRQDPWLSLGTGFVLFLAIPVAAFSFLLTVFALPIAFLLAALDFIFIYLARIIFLLWAGTFLFERFGKTVSDLRAFFVGLLIYFLLSFVPLIFVVMTFSVFLFGTGAAFLTLREKYIAARK